LIYFLCRQNITISHPPEITERVLNIQLAEFLILSGYKMPIHLLTDAGRRAPLKRVVFLCPPIFGGQRKKHVSALIVAFATFWKK